MQSKVQNSNLIIIKANKKQLSKNQNEFNKLTQQIEKLQKEITNKQLKFDLAIKIYGTELYPLKSELVIERREIAITLWSIYKSKRLAKPDQRYLKEIVSEHLQCIFMELTAEPDEDLKTIFNEIEGENYDDALAEEKENARLQLLDTLKKLKVDLSHIDTNSLHELETKLYETKNAIYEEERSTNHKTEKQEKKKSIKQVEAEKAEALANESKQKNISTIYKQLAKLFHPDLEQDEARKIEKALLMQELTAAYEAKNLHALLMLELKWIHNENNHIESLTEEKLIIYLQILKEQIKALQIQKEDVFKHPQYAILAEEFGWEIQRYPLEIVKKHLSNTKKTIETFKENIVLFKSDHALKYAKQMIKHWKQEQLEYEEEEMLRQLFGH
jgi:hypothetical protein